jgi:hypothetical protein
MEVSFSTNEVNKYTASELDYMRESIENMNKFNQIEILKILNKFKDVILNENKNGIYVNLSELKDEIIEEINEFISYVKTQEKNLDEIEKQKTNFKNIYFSKDNKE